MKKKLKKFFKKEINNNFYFNIEVHNNSILFKLNKNIPLSDTFLIIKHHSTGKRILKKLNKSVSVDMNEIIDIGELGLFDIYLQANLLNKRVLIKSPFNESNENKYIFDKDKKLIFKSVNKDSKLAFELRNAYDESLIDITKVCGEDISEIIYNKPYDEEFPYKLSAIVLVYNGGDYLRQCINSLVNQTIDGLEIILINDKSTDDSLDICKEFAMQFDNIRIIDKQENHGLATSANMGIQIAKGEYVILVDNDDIVPADAYEKLYSKAKEADADISVGQANLLYGDRQNEMYEIERRVLEEEKVINDITEFPCLFNDPYYWNKIIKKSLIIDNDIKLPTGMIYADRKFAHMAYIYANTISIIPDCVYLWRIRLNDKNNQSLSRRRNEAWNYSNRIDSYESDLDKFINFYPDYFKILMRRIITPINGILDSSEFEEVFYSRGAKLLKDQCLRLEDIYDNQFYNWDNIIIYLVLNDYRNEIKEFLEIDLDSQREIINEDNKSYWNLPLFRNKQIGVPDELFEIKSMIPQFLEISEIAIKGNYISFENIKIPKYLKAKKCEINFMGKTNYKGVLSENSLSYELNYETDNIYNLKVPLSDLADFEVYDIFFKAYYDDDRFSNSFRISESSIKSLYNEYEQVIIGITKFGNLSIIAQNLKNKFIIDADDNAFKIIINEKDKFKQDLIFIIEDDLSNEKIYLNSDNDYSLRWNTFLESNSTYSLKFLKYNQSVDKRSIELNNDYLINFNEININNVSIFKDENGNIKLSY